MTELELKKRTKKFALDIIAIVELLPKDKSAGHIGHQLLRAATSIGANYRSACRAKSGADFIAKLAICEEEADECQYWIELLVESNKAKPEAFRSLWKEASELTAIITASLKTAKANKGKIQNSKSKV